MTTPHTHADHDHQHGPGCGHTGVEHEGHVDYLHDGHLHHPDGGQVEEHRLPVSTDMPNGVLELMKLYPQPVRMQSGGGVEYLPVPRQKEVAREA